MTDRETEYAETQVRLNRITAEFNARNPFIKMAEDPDLGKVVPLGIVTPSRLEAYYEARGARVRVTLDRRAGKFWVEPRYESKIGVVLRKVEE